MLKSIAVGAAAVLTVSAANSHSAGRSAVETAVAAYDEAQVRGDREALERLLAPDYVLVNSGGAIQDKAEFIRDLTDPAYHLDPFQVRQPVRRVWAGGAVMGGIVRLRGRQGADAFDACLRFADVWSLRGRRWQVAYTQVSRAPAGACGPG